MWPRICRKCLCQATKNRRGHLHKGQYPSGGAHDAPQPSSRLRRGHPSPHPTLLGTIGSAPVHIIYGHASGHRELPQRSPCTWQSSYFYDHDTAAVVCTVVSFVCLCVNLCDVFVHGQLSFLSWMRSSSFVTFFSFVFVHVSCCSWAVKRIINAWCPELHVANQCNRHNTVRRWVIDRWYNWWQVFARLRHIHHRAVWRVTRTTLSDCDNALLVLFGSVSRTLYKLHYRIVLCCSTTCHRQHGKTLRSHQTLIVLITTFNICVQGGESGATGSPAAIFLLFSHFWTYARLKLVQLCSLRYAV